MPQPPGRDESSLAGSLARLFLGQLAAVLAIAAVITVVVSAVRGDPEVRTAPPGGRPAATTSPAASPAAPSPAATSAPAATTSAAAPTTASTAPATAQSTPSPTPAALPRVDVLNQSAGSGAAARVARQLRDGGWRVGRVDDFRGNVSTTTVYWLDGSDRAAARELAAQLGGVRVRAGFSTLVDGRLSVVLVEPL